MSRGSSCSELHRAEALLRLPLRLGEEEEGVAEAAAAVWAVASWLTPLPTPVDAMLYEFDRDGE